METPIQSLPPTQGGNARNGAVALLWVCTLTTVAVVWLGSPMAPFMQSASVASPPQAHVSMPTLGRPAPLHLECVDRQDRVATDQTRPSTPERTPARRAAQPAADQVWFLPTPPTPVETLCVATRQPTPEPSK